MKIVRPEIKFACQGGFFDAVDDAVKKGFNITDEELDFLSENSNDEELNAFCIVGVKVNTFTEKRKALEVRNKYVELYYESLKV